MGILIFSFLLTMPGCDERITSNSGAAYSINGSLVKNLDNDSIILTAVFEKGDSSLGSGVIRLGSDTLEYNDTLYLLSLPAADSIAAGTRRLNIADPGKMNDSITFSIPANFAITSVALPDSRINPGGETVPIEWQVSAGSSGYAYGVIKRDTAYEADGYSQFTATGATSVSIPPDAFRLSGDLDTGWYYIYIYAFYGSPTEARNLPTKFPAGIPANVAHMYLAGSWGAILVAPHDSIYVATE
jgi:hypothetical protein